MPLISQILRLFNCLSIKQRRQLVLLQVLMLFAAFMELAGVAAIAPFIAVSLDRSILDGGSIIAEFYRSTPFETHASFLVFLGSFFFVMILINGITQIITLTCLYRFSYSVGGYFASTLNGYFLAREFRFFLERNSAELINKVINDANRVAYDVVIPLLRLNSKIFSIALLVSFFVYLDPIVAMLSTLVVGLAYYFIYWFAKGRVRRNGEKLRVPSRRRMALISESYEAIREIKVFGVADRYRKSFDSNTREIAGLLSNTAILGSSPYHIMEMVAMGGIALIAVLLLLDDGNTALAMSTLGLYAMVGFRLLPAFQQAYNATIQIKGSMPSFLAIEPDLLGAAVLREQSDANSIALRQCIELTEVNYAYPGSEKKVLNDVSIRLPAGRFIAVVGKSGEGKSTLVDLLLGMMSPDQGSVVVDGVELSNDNVQFWQREIGYVPQHISLIDGSVLENIAFGIEPDGIDLEKVKLVAHLAGIDRTIENMPEGYSSQIGQRGVKLSGGQKQRVGIARALYRDPSLILLDEGTSALDVETENKVINSLLGISKNTTVVMVSHRPTISRYADIVIRVEDGRVFEVTP